MYARLFLGIPMLFEYYLFLVYFPLVISVNLILSVTRTHSTLFCFYFYFFNFQVIKNLEPAEILSIN